MAIEAWLRRATVILMAITVSACNPSDTRPGLWLSGEPAAFATDWSFTDTEAEIALEVQAPYLLPHSVTIWCASMDGALYVAARDPDEKRWPSWVDRDPNVRILVAGRIYDARLEPLDDAATIDRLRTVYESKYRLGGGAVDEMPSVRYWRVLPRA